MNVNGIRKDSNTPVRQKVVKVDSNDEKIEKLESDLGILTTHVDAVDGKVSIIDRNFTGSLLTDFLTNLTDYVKNLPYAPIRMFTGAWDGHYFYTALFYRDTRRIIFGLVYLQDRVVYVQIEPSGSVNFQEFTLDSL